MAKIASLMRRTRWLLWHPEQKLWNWSLVRALRRPLGNGKAARVTITALIGIDSMLLAGRVWRRRLRRSRGGSRPASGARPPVLYIDCGVHKLGEQIRWMHEWFGDRYELRVLGFEASGEHVRDAAAALADLEGVHLVHAALVGPDHEGGEVRLYKSAGGEGQGDSLFTNDREDYDVVPARRLSDVLAEEGYSLSEVPVILRMNIEGAEHYVIEDLIAAGLHTSIDGYYGLWDDLTQVDPAASQTFRALLRENGISTITFNDRDLLTFEERSTSLRPRDFMLTVRDLSFRLRRRAIRADIEASLQAGLARVNGARGEAAPSRSAASESSPLEGAAASPADPPPQQ
ncbi:MAG: hypothetical protein JWL67_1270 [Solirubrobacterales bacterium]|nr:hypothetical protein [Solirubrobacterales bacterium]